MIKKIAKKLIEESHWLVQNDISFADLLLSNQENLYRVAPLTAIEIQKKVVP